MGWLKIIDSIKSKIIDREVNLRNKLCERVSELISKHFF
jgi:hypothetical protein